VLAPSEREALVAKSTESSHIPNNISSKDMPPVSIIPLGDGKYKVQTPNGMKSKSTSLEKAKKQKRLIDVTEHGFKPRKK
jgi:hypothetical protein